MEKPPIIDERLREVGRGAASKIARRMGYLKLFTYGSAFGLGAYFALAHEFNHPITGESYEHVFSPLRRFFWRNVDEILGVHDDKNSDSHSKVENIEHDNNLHVVNRLKVKDIRFTPKELKEMKNSGMTVPEIQKVSQERYDQFRRNFHKAKQERIDANENSK